MLKGDMASLTINWDRCIHINREIDDDLVLAITPAILALRQQSSLPITIAINSPGGSLDLLEVIMGLVQGPNQDNETCSAITVSVHRAYSAGAVLLVVGDYAVALPHSEILFHDVRYGGMEDVTPSKAKVAASKLKNANDASALKLASYVFQRLLWNYIDLRGKFEKWNAMYPEMYEKYRETTAECMRREMLDVDVDIAGFLTSLHANVSRQSEKLIDDAAKNLRRWGMLTTISDSYISRAKEENSDLIPLLHGSKELFSDLRHGLEFGDGDEIWQSAESELQIIYTLLVEKVAKRKFLASTAFPQILESVVDDYEMIRSINDPSHYRKADSLLLEHKKIFFSRASLEILIDGDEVNRRQVLDAARPSVKLLWHFCVLLCRELFNGEHILTPEDAQVLGIIDEVAGGGRIESPREFKVKN